MKTLLTSLLLFAVPALAQAEKEAKPAKTQTITFDGNDLITGERETPFAQIFEARQPPRFKRLFKVRQNFDDKLAQSVHEM